MTRTVLAAFALIGLLTSATAQNLSADDLNRRMIERRAVEAVIWGMPAVNTDLMRQQMLTKTSWQGRSGHLLGPAARLEKPDADTEPRRALLHDVL